MVNLPQANATSGQQRKPRRSLTTRAINDYPAHAGRSAPATPVGRDEVRWTKSRCHYWRPAIR